MDQSVVSGDQNMQAAAAVSNVPADSNSNAQMVPLSALQAEREARQRLQDEVKLVKDHVHLLQANHQPPPAPPQRGEFDGMSQLDVVTVGDLERVFAKKEQEYSLSIQRLAMAQKHPDYFDVVNKYLPSVIEKNPALANTIVQSKDLELAYYLAKSSDAYRTENAVTKQNADAQRIVDNAQRAGSLSSVGQTSPISQAKQYKEMSDSDFTNLVNKNMGYF